MRNPRGGHSVSDQDENVSLEVYGLECRIFDNPHLRALMHAEDHLVACAADPEATVDRFDVRSLLDTIPKKQANALIQEEEAYEAALDQWRYYDLPPDQEREEQQRHVPGAGMAHEGAYALARLSYKCFR
jgi:hypothetical protein